MPPEEQTLQEQVPQDQTRLGLLKEMRTSEDWWAIWCGGLLLGLAFLAVCLNLPNTPQEQVDTGKPVKISSPLKSWLSKPGKWTDDPTRAFYIPATGDDPAVVLYRGVAGAFLVIGVLFAGALWCRGERPDKFLIAFTAVFLLATLAYVLAGQSVVRACNLEYALWALLAGLLIGNTVGTPAWLKQAVLTEFYIKTGLVLLGAEVLMSRLLALGLPGIFVAWVVTPVVLISTYIFGQKILKVQSRSLNMVISADMSVCGVSAAIATAAACRAKKEELTLAVGLSLSFTAVMMVALPALISLIGMDPILGGAWIGGTIDATGAVVAAGATLGAEAEQVATTVKMIQNILIGVTAFGVAVYWVTFVDRDTTTTSSSSHGSFGPSAWEIWYRFPKFVLGFAAASIVFSILYQTLPAGPEIVDAVIKDSTKTLRGWFFCLAFVSIGLQTNFRALIPFLRSGRPLVLYVCGQTLNLCLTLLMAWLMFGVVFKDRIAEIMEMP